jgi:nucleotide-binding universal stress UspA family protein
MCKEMDTAEWPEMSNRSRLQEMRILLAIDDSKCSEAATESIIGRSSPAGTEVQVLHVVDVVSNLPISYTYAPAHGIEILEREKVAQAEQVVGQAADRLRAAGLEVQARVEKGVPKDKILEVAATWKADLVVTGSHGRGGMERFLLGSVSEAIARYAPCSVEIVRIP